MAKDGDPQALRLVVERILPVMKAFEEPRQVSHNIEVVLREPEWLKLRPPQPVTIEHEPKRHPIEDRGSAWTPALLPH